MAIWEDIKNTGGRFIQDFLSSLSADILVFGRHRRPAPAPVPATPQAAVEPAREEIQRQFAGLGFSDEAATAVALSGLEVADAVVIGRFYRHLKSFEQQQFKAVVSTIPTSAERTAQLKLLAQVPVVPREPEPQCFRVMREVAIAFQFIPGEPSLYQRGMEWLRQQAPQMWQQMQTWPGAAAQRLPAVNQRLAQHNQHWRQQIQQRRQRRRRNVFRRIF